MAEKEVRLIDANALESALEETNIRYSFDKRRMFELIRNAPTICPCCGMKLYGNGKECPNCGTKMKLKGE